MKLAGKLSSGSAAIVSLALVAAGGSVLAGSSAAVASAAKAKGTVITTRVTPFGRALVVGSGKYKGFSLYFITSDHGISSKHGRHFGCTARPVHTPVGKLLCTGPSGDRHAEWPAITTTGKPLAAGGVSQAHLGTVRRAHVGVQITYYGHPLYLFDQGPGQVTGEGWNEPALPPWHGLWYLISTSGKAVAWPGGLTTVRIGGHKVLAALMLTGIGWLDFPVYKYSKDKKFGGTSACTHTCARLWPPMLTSGFPGVSTASMAAKVNTLGAPSGTQVAFAGRPLYLFSNEVIVKTGTGYKAIGSGAGRKFRGGTFSLVTA
jgi:predicted lipoprotein with Yx(FWY)xxD motif